MALSLNEVHQNSIISQENKVLCPECPQARYFKGQKGLKIHQSKCHRSFQIPLSAPVLSSVIANSSSVSTATTSKPFWEVLSSYKKYLPVLKRIPRGARISVAQSLSSAIRNVLSLNTKHAWEHLLSFPYHVLYVQLDHTNKLSLTKRVKENCVRYKVLEEQPLDFEIIIPPSRWNSCLNSKLNNDSIAFKIVESKISDGDIKGAARVLFSGDTIAPYCTDTIQSLKDKHPPAATNLHFPEPPQPCDVTIEVTPQDVAAAVSSFQSGSAGGLDGLSPQHLKDVLSGISGEVGEVLLRDLTALVNLMLSGQVNGDVTEILYGANLCALIKKDGGIRPIAVGTTYRRLAAKAGCRKKVAFLSNLFQPLQLGFGSRGGCEAAVHSLRTFLGQNCGEVLLKVDVKNAFNSVDRGALLTQVKDKIPDLYNFLYQCYGKPSKLVYQNNVLLSSVGCQQGDPLGPAIFSLAIHPIIQRLQSKLNVWYLDDGTLGGDANTVLNDLATLIDEFSLIGLDLNFSKCELFVCDSCSDKNLVFQKFNSLAPNIKLVDKCSLRLLGSPILDESFAPFVEEKIQKFNDASDRLLKINSHMAFTIIRFCLFVPKFTYVLRCCQMWKHNELLLSLDNIVKHTLISVLNVDMDDRTWLQASLPVRCGGLGIRKISSVALPAFLSSVHGTHKLIDKILAPSLGTSDVAYLSEAKNAWVSTCPNTDFPVALSSQRLWDRPICDLTRKNLLDTCPSVADRARLLAVSVWESGLWLQAIPSFNTGNFLDPTAFRLAISLRLGAKCCVAHRCQCGTAVDQLGHHGLSCSKSAGRISRHASLNDIIRRAFTTANVAAILEPNGLMRDDGKRPDGMTLIPWKMGRPLVWDATCVDTMAPSHLPETHVRAGAAANSAERLKQRKYSSLGSGYIFEPFGVETLGPWGPGAHRVFKSLSERLVDATRDQNAGTYLAQRISIAIQRGNAASMLGTLPTGSGLEHLDCL